MTNLAMLVVCLFAGMLLRRFDRVPENAHVALNGFIIHVALPALVLAQVHGLHVSRALIWPVAMPWLLFVLAAAVFVAAARWGGMSRSTAGALILTSGLANTSFVGLPMIETFYGTQDLSTGILIDQLGSYLVLNTLGITVACILSAASTSPREVLWRILRFPPLIALVVALLAGGLDYPPWLSGLFHRIGDTLSPLALVSVGLQLRHNQLRVNRLPLGLGLGFKLVLAPLLLALVYVGVFGQRGETTQVTLFEGAMGPMIGGSIVAMQYGFDAPLITLMVGLGIALSFLTLPLWYLGLALI